MTRQEAVEKFYDIMYANEKLSNKEHDRKWANKAIRAYEALGLLKFDDAPISILNKDQLVSNILISAYEVKNAVDELAFNAALTKLENAVLDFDKWSKRC